MTDDYFALACLLTGLSSRKISFSLKKSGCFKDVWQASEDDLVLMGLSPEEARTFFSLKKSLKVNRLLDNLWVELQKRGIKIVTLIESSYPSLLKEIPDPPLLLFYQGELADDNRAWVAVVGSRVCSSRGKNLTRELSFELSNRGFGVVSGLARGIDTYAHLGALEGKGRTIAVLGCGLDIDYPPENRSLKKRIIEKGAVLTEFLPGTEPLAYNFPQRNRIIAGLSKAVIVVEARVKSGALITAHLAADYGREVMAFPGNPENPYARGCNRLIKEGAYLVENLEDILEILGFPEKGAGERKVFNLSEKEKKIVEFLQAGDQHVDKIISVFGQESLSLLTLLEVKGIICRQPGPVFSLNPRLKSI